MVLQMFLSRTHDTPKDPLCPHPNYNDKDQYKTKLEKHAKTRIKMEK
jgi:hypothetical protein